MEHLEKKSDLISNLYKEFLAESEAEWYDDPDKLFEENSEVVDGKLKAEDFAKLNAKYTSKVVFGYKEEMAKKLFEVTKNLLTKKFGKDFWQKTILDLGKRRFGGWLNLALISRFIKILEFFASLSLILI